MFSAGISAISVHVETFHVLGRDFRYKRSSRYFQSSAYADVGIQKVGSFGTDYRTGTGVQLHAQRCSHLRVVQFGGLQVRRTDDYPHVEGEEGGRVVPSEVCRSTAGRVLRLEYQVAEEVA